LKETGEDKVTNPREGSK